MGIAVCYFFRALNGDLDPKFGLEFLCGRRESIASVGIHPDQKLAVGPGEEVHRDQMESDDNRNVLFHFGARRLLPDLLLFQLSLPIRYILPGNRPSEPVIRVEVSL
jgi:hypothetical protein